jgi:hypothetical protein
MNILIFNKITKPIYEGGASIDLTPKGKWFIQVRKTDGTIRLPFGDKWIDNLFLNGYADGQLSGGIGNSGFSWSTDNQFGITRSFLNLFYGTQSSIAVGSGTTPVQITDTGLANQIRFDSTPSLTGNTISWSSTTGNIVYTIKEQFPTETGSVTYNEAGIRITGGNNGLGLNGLITVGSNRLINRVVFPASVNLIAGEQLILTVAVTIPTLASSAGKTITIAAQNGVNISGVLKVIGTQASMAGGTVTSDGITSLDTSVPILFSTNDTPVALLSTKTAFDTLGVNPTWGTTNQVNGLWGTYTNGTRFRDVGYQWGSGTPATDTNFRSILFRSLTSVGARGGYQLLLDNQMTKASTATLALSLRFSV